LLVARPVGVQGGWGGCCKESVIVQMLWSVVELLLRPHIPTTSDKNLLVKVRSIVDGDVKFLGWWVGIPGLLWRQKSCRSNQCAINSEGVLTFRICGLSIARFPAHQGWWALKSPMRRQEGEG
jgi:hypothetical protein